MTFNKISVKDELPKEDGKYIVFTITPFKNVNVFECSYKREVKKGKEKITWGCNNQIVTHWLKEEL